MMGHIGPCLPLSSVNRDWLYSYASWSKRGTQEASCVDCIFMVQFLAGFSDSFRTMRANYGWNEGAMDRAITGFMGTALALHGHGTK